MRNPLLYCLFLLLSACNQSQPVASNDTSKPNTTPNLFVGTYTQDLGFVNGKAKGIYVCHFNAQTGVVTVMDSVINIDNPSFLAWAPRHKVLYSVSEGGGSAATPYGKVVAYQLDTNDKLLKINEMPSYGAAPCHISTDPSERFLFVANYVTGNVANYTIKPDGSLSDSICTRQHPGSQPHAHQVRVDPKDQSLLWAVDKGADAVFQYRIGTEDGALQPIGSLPHPKGEGPRHMDFYPSDPSLMAVVNELKCSVRTIRRNAQSEYEVLDRGISTLPDNYKGKNTCADIHFHPTLPILYASNRGHNSIVVYRVDTKTGRLTPVQHVPCGGEIPRNFTVTPDGRWVVVANQNTSNVASFRVDQQSGLLDPNATISRVATPVCLVWK
jgi:6-phosphogluconolactonase